MTDKKFNEDTLSEQPAIKQLKKLGYNYINGDKFDPELIEDCERKSRRDVILVQRLKKKLLDINPQLTEESIGKAIRKIAHFKTDNILEANQDFRKYLISGIPVAQDIGARRQNVTVNLIDFKNIENNEFLAVNQFWIKGYEKTARPDIIIFINGIPIVVIECKSPIAKRTGIIDAQLQLIRYQREIPQLFYTNEIIIASNLFDAEYGVIDCEPKHFHIWNDKKGENLPDMAEHPTVKQMIKQGMIDKKDLTNHPPMQEVLLTGILKKRNLLDIIQNFIVFDFSKEKYKVIKKVCRYQQYFAVNKIVNRIMNEDQKKGIIWHWQGSGKSLIMVFTAIKLKREQERMKNPAILIVTDRRKLDRQIKNTFIDCGFPNPQRAKSSKKLYAELKDPVGKTIMTTVQKFRKPLDKPLSESENIIVLTDEAHRTQYGNFALNMRQALPNASFFAFTGTPINKKDRSTYKVFSPKGEKYLHKYDMIQSLEDEATVPIKYESRMPNLQIVGASIDKLIERLFPDKNKKELAKIKRKYSTLEAILGAPERIKAISRDIVNHYFEKIKPNGFKAVIVASKRKIAALYKKNLDKLMGPSYSTIVMTVNNDDPEEWKRNYRRTAVEEDILTGNEHFQNMENDLRILIVVDKLLTGFDAPIVQAMYLDSRLKEHTLLQAIARTNRPFTQKNFGLIVDYVGVGKELATALSIFDQQDLVGLFSLEDLKNEVEDLKKIHKKILSLFKRINLNHRPEIVIQKCLEVIRPEDIRSNFDMLFRKYAKSVDILMPDPLIKPFLKDFKFLGMIREGAKNLYRDNRLTNEDISKKVESLIHEHIREMGIENILKPINITAPDFEEKLDVKGNAKAKASHVEYAIRDRIAKKVAEDPHFYGTLQEQLEILLEDYRIMRKDEAQLLKELITLGKEEDRRKLIAESKGLSMDEYAFYGLLKPYSETVFIKDDKKQCELTNRIVEKIQEKIVVDWVEREDIQKSMRREVKTLLREIGFPKKEIELFTREILELAKARFKDK